MLLVGAHAACMPIDGSMVDDTKSCQPLVRSLFRGPATAGLKLIQEYTPVMGTPLLVIKGAHMYSCSATLEQRGQERFQETGTGTQRFEKKHSRPTLFAFFKQPAPVPARTLYYSSINSSCPKTFTKCCSGLTHFHNSTSLIVRKFLMLPSVRNVGFLI